MRDFVLLVGRLLSYCCSWESMSLACEVQLRVVTIHILIMEFGGIAHECRYGVGQTTLNITVAYACFYFLFKRMAFTSSKL